MRMRHLTTLNHNILKPQGLSRILWKYDHHFLSKTNIMNCESLSRGKADHLSLTAENSRQDLIVPAKVTDIGELSRTVKLVKLNIQDPHFVFRAGQWVDMFIPGIDTVGGFSMCSAPHLLYSAREIHLAVKYSKHPPALWVHSKCKIGDKLKVRAGGDFYYDPVSPESQNDLLLIGGGVGINPLYSILLHFYSLHERNSNNGHGDNQCKKLFQQATMLFCARNEEELLFREEMKGLSQSCRNIQLQLHCTREKPQSDSAIIYRRIKEEDVQVAVKKLDASQTEAFICGPSPFITAMESYCANVGIATNHIHFEKWW